MYICIYIPICFVYILFCIYLVLYTFLFFFLYLFLDSYSKGRIDMGVAHSKELCIYTTRSCFFSCCAWLWRVPWFCIKFTILFLFLFFLFLFLSIISSYSLCNMRNRYNKANAEFGNISHYRFPYMEKVKIFKYYLFKSTKKYQHYVSLFFFFFPKMKV